MCKSLSSGLWYKGQVDLCLFDMMDDFNLPD